MVKDGKASTDSGRMELNTYKEFLKSAFWKQIRKSILKKQDKCFLCHYNKKLQIHHITYRGMFRPDKGQLVVLCRKHHKEVEDIPFKYRSSQKCFHLMQRNYKNRKPISIGLKDRYVRLKTYQKSEWGSYFKRYPNGIFTKSD